MDLQPIKEKGKSLLDYGGPNAHLFRRNFFFEI
jgi:hypothetical protein